MEVKGTKNRFIKQISKLLACVMFLSSPLNALTVNAAVPTTVYLCKDFEEYTGTGKPPLGLGFTGNKDAIKTSGAIIGSGEGTGVELKIEDTVVPTQTPDIALTSTFSEEIIGEVIIAFDIKFSDANGSRFIEIQDSLKKGMTIANIQPDGKVVFGKDLKKVQLKKDAWQRLSFAIDFVGGQPKQSVTFYLDGIKQIGSSTGGTFEIPNTNFATGMGLMRVRPKRIANATGTFSTQIDNIAIYSGTELKTMEELKAINKPNSLMDVDNDLGISVANRLTGALVMVANSKNVLKDNIKEMNALNDENKPRKIKGEVYVPLNYIANYFGTTLNTDNIRSVVTPSQIIRTSNDTLVPIKVAEEQLGKKIYTDYKGRGLIVIGDNAAPFDDSQDKADVNVKPKDNEKFFIEEAIKEVVYDRPTGQEAMNVLRSSSNKGVHPRIIATEDDFARVKYLINLGDPTMTKWYGDIKKQGEKHLQMPVPTDDLPDGRRMIGSRQVGPLVINLGMLYHLSDDTAKKEAYKERIWQEVSTVAQFPSWNEDNEFLNTAEFMEGLAIAYDWLYEAWTPEQKAILEEAMIKKGLEKSLEAYNKNVWWMQTYPRANNWNAVCNGSTVLTVLAIGDIEKNITLASAETVTMEAFGAELLDVAFNALEDFILLEFTPDGAWAEGPSYWKYTLEYLVRFMASLESALGTAYGYDQTPGLNKTAYFPTYLSGPIGALNYGDASSNKVIASEALWVAKKYEDKLLNAIHLDNKIKYKNAGSEFEMLWYVPENYIPNQTLELDQYFSGTEVATFRSKWEDINTSFLGFKAGNNVVSHGHYDLGSFVFEALGQQWALDLGKDDYNLPGYSDYDNGRLNYYRLNPEGHNTLVINPDGGAQQNIKAFSKMERYESKPLGGLAIANLTEAYNKNVTDARRGVMLSSNRTRATIQDEVVLQAPSTAYWFMHTEAEIEVSEDGQSAILSKGGEKLWVGLKNESMGGNGDTVTAKFEVMAATPLPQSPNPTKQNQNVGIRKLFIKLNDVEDIKLAVTMIPVVGSLDELETNTAMVALDKWNIPDGELIIPVLSGVSIDGLSLAGFNEKVFSYTIELPLDRTKVPEVSIVYDKALYEVNITPTLELPGTTKVMVTSLTNPEIKSIYNFNFKLVPLNGEEERLEELVIKEVTASASQEDKGNTEDKAIDGDLDTYWGAEGDQWIQFDLGEAKTINSVGIAFIKGNEREFKFDIETSLDGQNWYRAFSGTSTGGSLAFEKTYLKQHLARYVRVVGHGNSVNQWNSYAEVKLYTLSACIENIKDITQVVRKDDAYTLPDQVEAQMSDETTKQVNITWDGIAKTTTPGAFGFKGRVSGYDKDVNLTLKVTSLENPDEIAHVKDIEVTVKQYKEYSLPHVVETIKNDLTRVIEVQ